VSGAALRDDGSAQLDLSVLADQLGARTHGVELTGSGGLLTGLTTQVLETARCRADREFGPRWGRAVWPRQRALWPYAEDGPHRCRGRADHCPADRAATFTPAVVPKHTRRLPGFDDAVLSLYATPTRLELPAFTGSVEAGQMPCTYSADGRSREGEEARDARRFHRGLAAGPVR